MPYLLCRLSLVLCVAISPMVTISAHGDLHEQLARLEQEIAAHPNDGELRLRRALVLLAHEEAAEALAEVDRAAGLTTMPAGIDGVRGRVLVALNRAAEALEYLDRHLARWTDDLTARSARVDALLALDRDADALHELSVILDQRFDLEVASRRASLLARLGQIDSAITGLDALRDQHPDASPLDQIACDIERQAGLTSAALVRAERIATSLPIGRNLLQLGDVRRESGHVDGATTAWRLAITWLDELPAHRQQTTALRALRATLQQRLTIPSPTP